MNPTGSAEILLGRFGAHRSRTWILCQKASGDGIRIPFEFDWSSRSQNLTAMRSGARAKVDHIVCLPDHVQIVLDKQDRVSFDLSGELAY